MQGLNQLIKIGGDDVVRLKDVACRPVVPPIHPSGERKRNTRVLKQLKQD